MHFMIDIACVICYTTIWRKAIENRTQANLVRVVAILLLSTDDMIVRLRPRHR